MANKTVCKLDDVTAAAVFGTGNLTPPTAVESTGFWPFADDVLGPLCDSRTRFKIYTLPHDSIDATLTFVTSRILRMNPKYIVCGIHSHGVKIMLKLANILSRGIPEQNQKGGRNIDLAWCVDPVPHDVPLWEMLTPTDKPWILPPNVVNAVGFQTLNWRPGMPFGRRIATAEGVTANIRRVFFDGKAEDYDGDLLERWVKDGSVDHANIDNSQIVWEEMVRTFRNLVFGETNAPPK